MFTGCSFGFGGGGWSFLVIGDILSCRLLSIHTQAQRSTPSTKPKVIPVLTRRKRGWNLLEIMDTAGPVHALLAADGVLVVGGSAAVQVQKRFWTPCEWHGNWREVSAILWSA